MDLDDFETTVKVIVVGNGQVGKTSMSTRYCKGRWTDTYKKTIGVDFMEKSIDVEELGETVRLMVWDTAGQEEFDSLTSRYYKGAGAALLVFSTVDRDSFDALPTWKKKVEEECGTIAMCIVQNKIDLIDQAVMTNDEVEDMAATLGLRLYRTCVKENVNVQEAFEYVTTQYILGGNNDNTAAVAHIGEHAAGAVDTAAESKPAPKVESAEGKVAEPTPKPSGAAVQLSKSTLDGHKPSRRRTSSNEGTFKLSDTKPSKQRTGGKKGWACIIL